MLINMTAEQYAMFVIAMARTLPRHEQGAALGRALQWIRAIPASRERAVNHWWCDVDLLIEAADSGGGMIVLWINGARYGERPSWEGVRDMLDTAWRRPSRTDDSDRYELTDGDKRIVVQVRDLPGGGAYLSAAL
jgi:hypothetical protein